MRATADDGDPLARHALSAPELKELMRVQGTGAALLAYRDEDGELRLFTTGGREGVSTIGRRAETDVCISWDPQVSGLHAELHHGGGEWAIVDDGLSTNGTFVDGQRIVGRQRLRDESLVRVGNTTLVYRAAQHGDVRETEVAGNAPQVQLTDLQRRVLVALCRPYRDGDLATPARNQEIAAELFLSVDAVKMHLRTLFGKFGLGELPQNQKRARLVERALLSGAVTRRELQ